MADRRQRWHDDAPQRGLIELVNVVSINIGPRSHVETRLTSVLQDKSPSGEVKLRTQTELEALQLRDYFSTFIIAVVRFTSTPGPVSNIWGGRSKPATLNLSANLGRIPAAGAPLRGYEIAPNEFAVINPQKIKAAEIETSDTIDLFHFVKASEVDPIYFERSYYVAPESGSEKVYVLLREAMRKEECFGIARIGMHRREHMLILRPSQAYLVAHTMFYANEVRPAPQVELTTEFSSKELSMATALIKGYEGEFNPSQFKDLYQERVRKIIDAEVSNRIPMHPAPKTPTSGAPDLMEQIRLSLAELESKKPGPPRNQVRKTPNSVKKKPQRVHA